MIHLKKYITVCSCLETKIYNIKIPKDVFNQLKVGQKLSTMVKLSKSQEFLFSEGKADAIKHMVNKENNISEAQKETEDTNTKISILVWSKEEIDILADILNQLVEELKINSKEKGLFESGEVRKRQQFQLLYWFIYVWLNLRKINKDFNVFLIWY